MREIVGYYKCYEAITTTNQFIITHSVFTVQCSCMRKMWTDVILCVNLIFCGHLWCHASNHLAHGNSFLAQIVWLFCGTSSSPSLMPMPPKCNTIIRSANRNRLNYLYSKWTNKLINCPKNFPVFVSFSSRSSTRTTIRNSAQLYHIST